MKVNNSWCACEFVCTSANSIPCGSRYRHIPWRWLSRKSSSRRNLTAQSERQSRQYTEISSSRDCRTEPHTHTYIKQMWNQLCCPNTTLSQQHTCRSRTQVCVRVTRSSSNVNFWSQAWLLTDLQLVWPTTVLSSFNTALISSEETCTDVICEVLILTMPWLWL